MAFDIHGEPLAPGHCEVHRSEQLPCQTCAWEAETDRQYAAYLAEREAAFYEALMAPTSTDTGDNDD